MATVPEVRPVTLPVLLTVAMVALLVVQLPPVVVSVSIMVLPAHTVDGPLIAPTTVPGVTVMVSLVAAVPQVVVTT